LILRSALITSMLQDIHLTASPTMLRKVVTSAASSRMAVAQLFYDVDVTSQLAALETLRQVPPPQPQPQP